MNIEVTTQVSRVAGNGEGLPTGQVLPETDHRESSPDYGRVLAVGGRYRVAICRDGLQWLYQQRVTRKTCAGARWRTLGFCTTRKALMRLQHRFNRVPMPELSRLPETFRQEAVE